MFKTAGLRLFVVLVLYVFVSLSAENDNVDYHN